MFRKKIDIYDYFKLFISTILQAPDTLHIINKRDFNDEQISKLNSNNKIISLMFIYGIFIEQMNSQKIPKIVSDFDFFEVFCECLILISNKISLDKNEFKYIIEKLCEYIMKLDVYLIKNDSFLVKNDINQISNKIGFFLTEELLSELNINEIIDKEQKEEFDSYCKKYNGILSMLIVRLNALNNSITEFFKLFKVIAQV